jgi:Holliday junction resolvase RusA-like endonuclease
MQRIEFTVERPRSKKNRMFHAKGRVFKPKEIVAFEELVRWTARNAYHEIGLDHPHEGRVEVFIIYDPQSNKAKIAVELYDAKPMKRRRKDIQNLPDTILDAMNGSVYADDCQVEHLTVRLGVVT